MAAVDFARQNNRTIIPVCSYARMVHTRTDEYKDVLWHVCYFLQLELVLFVEGVEVLAIDIENGNDLVVADVRRGG